MTFAEMITFLLVGFLVYRALRPLQERLEIVIRRWLGLGPRRSSVIDITDYSPKPNGKTEKDK